jgi:exodeoxyribonuclease V alpha subunit
MTVHKAQGSEFDRVLLLLPDRDLPVLSRELLYTAATRARRHIEIQGPVGLIRKTVSRTAERVSGLAEKLWHRPQRRPPA